MQAVASRMAKEIRMLHQDPPPGVWAAPVGDSVTQLEAQLQGPLDTVYEGGLFKMAVDIPARYPFEPPKVKFVTKIYHPNIDPEGRICLDILNMPPKGAWKPSLNIGTVLASVGLLLAEPNADDGLVADTTAEFKHQRQVFDAKARQWTQRYAVQQGSAAGAGAPPVPAPAAAGGASGAGPGSQDGSVAAAEVPGGQAAATVESSKENSQPGVPEVGGKQTAVVAAAAAAAAEAGAAGEAGAAAAAPGQPQPAKRPRLALRK